ncbi:hypothetical protein N1851_009936 [Merluccius polli]|uniref:HAT C-terminal dimerisation domain-containing protein n=1 Tax=Merluccius polli TaxID=89951 RepID=A0AA47P3K7_MERPO|nr:hypothetical protein N1851_009936 [Merluccius polli]
MQLDTSPKHNVSLQPIESLVLQLLRQQLRNIKQQFVYKAHDEPVTYASKGLEDEEVLNAVVDAAKSSIDERFVCLSEMKDKFIDLTTQCETLSADLTKNSDTDIDGEKLALELKNLPQLHPPNMTLLGLLSFIHTQHLKEVYPNLWTALCIAFTLQVTAASVERSFS